MADALEVTAVSDAPVHGKLLGRGPVLAPHGLQTAVGAHGLTASISSALDLRRLFVLLPFAMTTGVVACANLERDPPTWTLLGGIAAVAIALAASTRWLAGFRTATLIGAFWLGFCLLPIHGALFGTAMLSRPSYGSYQVRVDEIVEATPQAQRVVVSQIVPEEEGDSLDIRRARVLVKQAPPLSPGDGISGSFRFSPVPAAVVPGGYDTQFQSYFDGIGAYGNSIRAVTIVATGSDTAPDHFVNAIRTGIASRIDSVLTQPSAGVARAIINGDQSEVGDDVRTTMATAGIAHVLSVSGLHLTIVAGGVFWILRLALAGFGGVAGRVSIKRLAAIAGMSAALFYFAISGGNVAAFRSTLMILLVFGAVLVGRRALTMRNVAIAGIIVIACDPASVFRPSFQLSFAAVIALVGAYENLRSGRGRDASLLAHVWGYAKGIVITSLVAGTATLLFSIYHFQQTSPLGVLGNLATLPLVGFVMMPAAALSVLAMPLGLERPFLLAMGWSIDRMLDMASMVAGLSQHLHASPLLTPPALLIGLGALAWFAFLADRWRLLGPAMAVPLVMIFAIDHPPDLLVADTTRSVAVRGADGLELADGKPQSFALSVWRGTYADAIAASAEEACDASACIGESAAGFHYAIVRNASAFPEECSRQDVIIARIRAPAWCQTREIIDPSALAAHGVYWLRWDPAGSRFEVRTALGDADRPWRIKP